jgi:hypothetical protein
MIPPIHIITRALHSCLLVNKLPEGTDFMLGDIALKCTYIVDVACEGLGIMELGLELCDNRCVG